MSKTVIHELLAVEQGLATTAKTLVAETVKKLSGKVSLFTGLIKSHAVFAEADNHLTQATEHVQVQSTVDAQLSYLGNELARYWDVTLQKEDANQRANADVVIDGVVIAANVPSIVLLGLEKKLTALLTVYNAIPTLDAAVAWEAAPAQGEGIFQTKYAVERLQTRVEKEYVTVSPATDRHPAQMASQDNTINVGKYSTIGFSGMITTADKAARITRLVALTRAIKQARQRANATEVDTSVTIGASLLNYING